MANRYPLILDVTDGNKIKELPSGDTLYLRNNSISDVQDITAIGTINAAMIKVNGQAVSAQSFTDLNDVPATYAGYENTFVRVNATADGLEFRPLTDFGTIQLTSLIVDNTILPAADVSGSVGNSSKKFNEMHAVSFIGDVKTLSGSVVFNATTGKISYSAISDTPTSLSEFTNDAGFVTLSTVQTEITSAINNLPPPELTENATYVISIKGSVVSTGLAPITLVDGTTRSINLDGTVQGDIVPGTGSLYDIGSSSAKFTDLYLSGSAHIDSTLILTPGAEPGTPVAGMIAVANGSTWAPAGAGVQALMIYLNSAWVQLS